MNNRINQERLTTPRQGT